MKKTSRALTDALDKMEHAWLDGGKKPYVAGDVISVADIFAACEIASPEAAK